MTWDEWLARMPEPFSAASGGPENYLVRLGAHVRAHPPLESLARGRHRAVIGKLNRRLSGLARVQYNGAKSRMVFGFTIGALTAGSVVFPPLIPVTGMTAWAMGLNEARVFQRATDLARTTDELSRLIDALIAQIEGRS